MIVAYILIGIGTVGALVLLFFLLRAERGQQWLKCPECHWYHRADGQGYSPEVPKESDGVIFRRVCRVCTWFENRERLKEFSRQSARTDGNA